MKFDLTPHKSLSNFQTTTIRGHGTRDSWLGTRNSEKVRAILRWHRCPADVVTQTHLKW